jgi:hypothetical protein
MASPCINEDMSALENANHLILAICKSSGLNAHDKSPIIKFKCTHVENRYHHNSWKKQYYWVGIGTMRMGLISFLSIRNQTLITSLVSVDFSCRF